MAARITVSPNSTLPPKPFHFPSPRPRFLRPRRISEFLVTRTNVKIFIFSNLKSWNVHQINQCFGHIFITWSWKQSSISNCKYGDRWQQQMGGRKQDLARACCLCQILLLSNHLFYPQGIPPASSMDTGKEIHLAFLIEKTNSRWNPRP